MTLCGDDVASVAASYRDDAASAERLWSSIIASSSNDATLPSILANFDAPPGCAKAFVPVCACGRVTC
eukprot:711191-Prymnesium_polylepis.1